MRPITVSVGPLASASATNVRTASGVLAAGAVTLNGSLVSDGVATFDTPRRVLFTTTADETTKTVTLTGTNWSGNPISETITLVNNSTVASVLDYKTLPSVVSSAALTGNLSIGTNGVAASPWVFLDPWAQGNVAMQFDVTGTVNYTIQSTLNDPNDPTNPVASADVAWIPSNDAAAVGATASIQTNFLFAPRYARILLNSGSGSVRGTFSQSGAVPQ